MVTEIMVVNFIGKHAVKVLYKLLLENFELGFLSDMTDELVDKLPEKFNWLKNKIKECRSQYTTDLCTILKEVIENVENKEECEEALEYILNSENFDIKYEDIVSENLSKKMIEYYKNNTSNYDGKYDALFNAFSEKYISYFWGTPHDYNEINEILRIISDRLRENKLDEEIKRLILEDKEKINKYYDNRVDQYEKVDEYGSSLLKNEPLKTAYIQARYEAEDGNRRLILDRIKEWNESGRTYGVMILHGQPGHGKTSLCKTAVYEFAKGQSNIESCKNDECKKYDFGRFKNASNVFHFSLNPADSDIIKDNELVIENSFVEHSGGKILVKPEECKNSIIFLDGYDELKEKASKTERSSFKKFVELAKNKAEYKKIFFVITSRTNAIKEELDEIRNCGFEILEFDDLTYDEQKSWVEEEEHKNRIIKGLNISVSKYWETCLNPILTGEKGESNKESKATYKTFKELLGIPVIFRLVLETGYKLGSNIQNRAALYENLFEETMSRNTELAEKKENLMKFYELIASRIFCYNDDTVVEKDKKLSDEISNYDEINEDKLVYSYYLDKRSQKSGQNYKIEIGFIHRSFYQFFFAKYLYSRILEVYNNKDSDKEGTVAEAFLVSLADRRVDEDTLDLLKQVFDNSNENDKRDKVRESFEIIYKKVNAADAIIEGALKPEYSEGNGDKSRHERCNNLLVNCMNISSGFKAWTETGERTGIKSVLEKWRYGLEKTALDYADLGNSDLVGANLRGANLNNTYLVHSYLSRADLEGAELKYADLKGANFDFANLENADFTGAEFDENMSFRGALMTNVKGFNYDFYDRHKKHDKHKGNKKLFEGADFSGTSLAVRKDTYMAVGSLYKFGNYWQNNSEEKEPIWWRILDIEKDGKALLLADKILDCQPYHKTWDKISWEECSLNRWLNEDFKKEAFDSEEWERICVPDFNNMKNRKRKIFLLSIKEVREYLSRNADDEDDKAIFYDMKGTQATAKGTDYAKKEGLNYAGGKKNLFVNFEGNSRWWLRGVSEGRGHAMRVTNDGLVRLNGHSVFDDSVGVRPALWLAL